MSEHQGVSGPERWCENGDLICPTGGTVVLPDGKELMWDGYNRVLYGTEEWREHVPHTPGDPPDHIREEVEEIIREWRRNLKNRLERI